MSPDNKPPYWDGSGKLPAFDLSGHKITVVKPEGKTDFKGIPYFPYPIPLK